MGCERQLLCLHVHTQAHTRVRTHTLSIYHYAREYESKDERNGVLSPPLIPCPYGAYTLKGNGYESNNHKDLSSVLTVISAHKRELQCYENVKRGKDDLFRKFSLKEQQH